MRLISAVLHVGPGDHPQTGHPEGLADLGLAQDLLALLRAEHPGQGRLHVVDRVVDHLVEADVDVLLLGQIARRLVGPHVEPDHDRVRRDGERDVALGDGARRAMHDVHADLLLRQLEERVGQRAERALHVGLHDQVELGDLRTLLLTQQIRERRRTGRHEFGRARARLPLGRRCGAPRARPPPRGSPRRIPGTCAHPRICTGFDGSGRSARACRSRPASRGSCRR